MPVWPAQKESGDLQLQMHLVNLILWVGTQETAEAASRLLGKRPLMLGGFTICTEMFLNGAPTRAQNTAEILEFVWEGALGLRPSNASHRLPIVPTGSFRDMTTRAFESFVSNIDPRAIQMRRHAAGIRGDNRDASQAQRSVLCRLAKQV